MAFVLVGGDSKPDIRVAGAFLLPSQENESAKAQYGESQGKDRNLKKPLVAMRLGGPSSVIARVPLTNDTSRLIRHCLLQCKRPVTGEHGHQGRYIHQPSRLGG